VQNIVYKKGCEELKLEAKDIPIMHKFMPEFWKTIKEFYGIEDDDEYWHALTERANELREVYPDSLVDYLTMAFVKWADDTHRKERDRNAV
jgi:hypothetical protein